VAWPRSWWLFLVVGILWILFGMLCCPTTSVPARLGGVRRVTFVVTGITQVLAAGRVDSWRWLYLVGGILSVLVGIVAFIWPGATLLVLSAILAWFLVFKGIVDTVGALASIDRPWWWVTLILGILELLFGMWAAGYPGRSLFVFVNLVGIYAVFYGVTELFAAFDLRGLDQRMNRPAMPSLRRRGAPFFCGVRQQVSPTRGPPLTNLAQGRHHGPDAGRPAGRGVSAAPDGRRGQSRPATTGSRLGGRRFIPSG
jgi:uncharacterized membrane protein HdeD (DUF308 family)